MKPLFTQSSHTKLFSGFSAFLFALAAVALFALSFMSNMVVSNTSYMTDVKERALIQFANQDRATYNMDALVLSPQLQYVAQMRAEHLVGNVESADLDRLLADVAFDGEVTENVVQDFYIVRHAHDAWMDQYAMRDNIMNPDADFIGIGSATGMINGEVGTVATAVYGARPEAVMDVLLISDDEVAEALDAGYQARVKMETRPYLAAQAKDTSLFERLAVEPSRVISFFYLLALFFLTSVFAAEAIFEYRKHHIRNSIFAVMLILFIFFLFILHKDFFLTPLIG